MLRHPEAVVAKVLKQGAQGQSFLDGCGWRAAGSDHRLVENGKAHAKIDGARAGARQRVGICAATMAAFAL
jgi:hypothetical protein